MPTREPGTAGHEGSVLPRTQLLVGRLWVDVLTRPQALDALAQLVLLRRGGAVFTPNVDHIVTAETDERLRGAYERANLSFADGAPVIWASWLLRPALPEKLSGSDMLWPIAELAARKGWRVYLLGGMPGSAIEAGARLARELGVHIVGTDDAFVPPHADAAADGAVMARIRAAAPDLVLVGLGAPKQEMFVDRMAAELSPAVAIGIGASLDFVSGRLRRAPAFMSTIGLEWAFRLAQEPRRLWKRYLIRDPRFAWLVMRTWMLPRAQRVRSVRPERLHV